MPVGLFCVITLISGVTRALANDGPVVTYRFNEGQGEVLEDAAGGGHRGQVTAPMWVRNRSRSALRFDGRNTFVVVNEGERLRFEKDFSLDLWFNTDATPGGNPNALAVKDGTFRLLLYPTEQQFLVNLIGTTGARTLYETVKTPVTIGQWHYVALTYSKAKREARLYLNGSGIFEQAADLGPLSGINSSIRIGLGISPEQKRYFKGMMAAFRLWDRALTKENIWNIMKEEKPQLASKFRGPEDLAPKLLPVGPLEVGDRKQLFIDDRFIEARRNVALTMNPPRRIGPVLLPDKPWESSEIGFCASVVEHEGLYRMFYRATSLQAGAFVCVATSKDGEHWEKPNLGATAFLGSKENNILFGDVGEATVFFDPNGQPDARFKALCVRHWPDPKRGGLYIYTSPDGIRWRTSDERVFPIVPDTANQAAWDTRLRKYVAYIRVWNPMRKVGRVEMDDILQPWPYDRTVKPYFIWGEDKVPVTSKEVPTVFGYGDEDPVPSDHYNAAAVEYPWAQDAYFMFPSAYYHFPDPPVGKYGNDGLLDIQMAVSRDGVAWHRLSRQPYIPLGFEGSKDSKQLYMAVGMLRRGNEILHYYAGYEVTHGEHGVAPHPRPIGSLCCAVQRLDGFISVDAPATGGELMTPPLKFLAKRLELNIDTSALGCARVGLLDAEGEPLPGFSPDDCDEIRGNFTAKVVTFKGNEDVSSLTGRTVRLHFLLRSAKLFAFQFR